MKEARWSSTGDGRLRLRTPTGSFVLRVEVKTSHLGPAVVRELAARARASGEPWILFAPFVSRPSAKLLAEHGVLFVDRGGNHRVVLGATYQSIVLGNPIATRATSGAGRLASQRVLFALLVKPELAHAPLRVVAMESGASKNAVSDALRRLEEEGLLVRTRKGAQLVGARALRSRWVAAWASLLRPQLLLGRFDHREQAPAAREAAIERALRATTSARRRRLRS